MSAVDGEHLEVAARNPPHPARDVRGRAVPGPRERIPIRRHPRLALRERVRLRERDPRERRRHALAAARREQVPDDRRRDEGGGQRVQRDAELQEKTAPRGRAGATHVSSLRTGRAVRRRDSPAASMRAMRRRRRPVRRQGRARRIAPPVGLPDVGPPRDHRRAQTLVAHETEEGAVHERPGLRSARTARAVARRARRGEDGGSARRVSGRTRVGRRDGAAQRIRTRPRTDSGDEDRDLLVGQLASRALRERRHQRARHAGRGGVREHGVVGDREVDRVGEADRRGRAAPVRAVAGRAVLGIEEVEVLHLVRPDLDGLRTGTARHPAAAGRERRRGDGHDRDERAARRVGVGLTDEAPRRPAVRAFRRRPSRQTTRTAACAPSRCASPPRRRRRRSRSA